MRSKNTALCPACGEGTILTGPQKEYNAKVFVDKKNVYVCGDCAIGDIYDISKGRERRVEVRLREREGILRRKQWALFKNISHSHK